jgi:hypothetical protein
MLYHTIMKFPALRIGFLVIINISSLLLQPAAAQQAIGACSSEKAELITIEEIEPGNIIRILDKRRIILSGIDTTSPTISTANHMRLKQLLANAEIKMLPTASKDRWGRIPAQIFVKPKEEESEAWLQGFLLEYGHARLSLDSAIALKTGNEPCLSAMRILQSTARAEKRGIWENTAAILKSAEPEKILKHRGELAYIQGEVIGIGETRSAYYLNFGRSWQKDLSVVVLKRHIKLFDAAGLSPRSLDRKHILIHGIVDGETGPKMEIQRPDQIEIVN